MEAHPHSRREFLRRASTLGAAAIVGLDPSFASTGVLPNPVGYATISWPERKFEHALDSISALGFKGVQMLGWVRDKYRGERVFELREKLQTLKLQPVTLSCSKITLDPEKPKDELGELRAYASFFQGLGGLYLQVTDGGDPKKQYSTESVKSLGVRITAMGRIAQNHGLTLGYHPHFNTIGETREGLARMMEATDPGSVMLIADVAHLTLGGADPAEVVRTYAARLILAHFKDVRHDTAALVRQNPDLARHEKHLFGEIGTGALDFPKIVGAFRETRFEGWIIVELDANKPPPGGPDESARTNREALKKLGFAV